MMPLAHVVLSLAAASSVTLAATALGKPARGRLRWSFGLGMIGLALESLTTLALMIQGVAPDHRHLWLTVIEIVATLLLIPWLVFTVAVRLGADTLGGRLRRALVLSGSGLVVTAAIVASMPAFDVAASGGPFYAARLDWPARLAACVQIVATVAVVAGLELVLRTSRGEARWKVKYLVLGLGGIFLTRFYFLSQIVLFGVLMGAYLTTQAAVLVVASAVIAASFARQSLTTDLAVSRKVVYQSVAVSGLGCYLLAVGVLGWVLNNLGAAEELLWGSVVVFVSVLALAAVTLSETVRWRIKKFVATNFYRTKYDYREQWTKFTRHLASLVTIEALCPEVLHTVTMTVGTAAGVLYLCDEHEGHGHAAASLGMPAPQRPLPDGWIERLRQGGTPRTLTRAELDALEAEVANALGDGAVGAVLSWHDRVAGVMLLGRERTGAPYGAEDLEFVATVTEQAAGAIATARLTESLAQAREFEAFHRLTSFVIHDLKNSIAVLSMLSENALKHFDDPEFQRDAIRTLARTVDRMRGLLRRLSLTPDVAALRHRPVDLATVALEAVMPLASNPRIALEKELAPVPLFPGDADALLRVLQNLVTNAIQSIDGEGLVTVRTYEDDGKATFAVSDTGCGMTADFIRKSLFAPFRSTKKGGWGIGLYHAKGIVEAHGGAIEVTSQVGTGTTFIVRFPIDAGGKA